MKRLIAFLLLLGLGVVALNVAIGDEDAVNANGNEPNGKPRRQSGPPGVDMSTGSVGASVTQHGQLDITESRDVPLPDGRIRHQKVYALKALDSQPVGEGLQQLSGVTLELFDDDKHVATVTADQAFVELGRNASGRPTIDQQKEIDVRGAVVTTEKDSKIPGMRLVLGDARITIGDDDVQLNTDDDQLVELVVAGDRPATLHGLGANARIPRGRDGGLQRSDITIKNQPVLESDGVRVVASGRMHYVEDNVTGIAQITLEDDVELDLSHAKLSLPGVDGGGAANDGRSAVRGDQFTGWLLRDRPAQGEERKGSKGGGMVWQRMLLVGAPATIDLPGMHVETPRLTVRPGPLGDPYVLTAHGGESSIRQTELRAGSGQKYPVVGTSPRRIHLIRPGDAVGALHRGFGFPQWTLRSLEQQQVLVFEGDSRLESGLRTLEAKRGFAIVRRRDAETGVVQGFGEVLVRQRGEPGEHDRKPRPELVATGSDGFVLLVSGSDERMHLGPPPQERSGRWRDHRYEVRYGSSQLRGTGACDITRQQQRVQLELLAPFDEIEADFAQQGTELRRVHRLHAVMRDDALAELDVGGLPVMAKLEREDEQVLAQAPRLLQIGPRSLRLLPMPFDEAPWSELPELARTPRLERRWREGADQRQYALEVFGPRIDVHHAGGRDVLVDASTDTEELPRVYARLPQPGLVDPTTVTCAARRLRILPFVLGPDVRRRLLGGMRGPVADTLMHGLAKPWLIVDDVRDFELDDEREGHIEGTGHRLFLSQGGAAALFVGDADKQAPAIVTRTKDGRTVAVEGARVRVYRDDDVRLAALGSFEGRSTFLAPTMTLHEHGRAGLLSHMRAVCRGNIQVDPDAVRFGGPVVAAGLKPDGDDDPDGVRIDAGSLRMLRQQSSGDVVAVTGSDVDIDWSKLDARAASIELDLLRSMCTATDPNGAEVVDPRGRRMRSRLIRVNYDTWSVSMGPGLVEQSGGQEGAR